MGTVAFGVVLPTAMRMGSRSLAEPVYRSWPLPVASPGQRTRVLPTVLRAFVPKVVPLPPGFDAALLGGVK